VHAMINKLSFAVGLWIAIGPFAVDIRAAAPIPADKRIEAEVVATLATPDDDPMRMPTDVAVDKSGNIYVADGVNDRIVRFTPDGKVEKVMTNWGEVRLKQPVGLAVDTNDRLWIADTGHHRLLVISKDGKLLECIDLPRTKDGHPFDPTDVTVTADRKHAFIVDNDNHRVLIRDNKSGRLTVKGESGRSTGQLHWPFMIATGPKDQVYVTEAIGARVQKLSTKGRWVGQIGSFGVQLGQFYRPKGVAVDADGRIYVGDSTLGVVQVFDSKGRIEGLLTGKDGRPLRLNHPMGMCIDGEGRLYVIELTSNRVAVIELAESSKSGIGQYDQRADAGGKQ